MTQITLVLPFALPPPELAQDLLRALKAPALATLLSRTSAHHTAPADDTMRALPHEAWLARALGLSADGQPGFARAAMRGYGLEADEGSWHIVNPAHIEIARTHLMMHDARQLVLPDDQSRALFEAARPYFDDSGKRLLYGDARTWFLRADDWAGLDTTTPDTATGLNLTDSMPRGERAVEFRKLQNEIQMLWFDHPVNAAREAAGQRPINGFWPWGGANAAPATQPQLATIDTLPWVDALASRKNIDPAQAAAAGADTIVYCDSLSQWAMAAEWAGWLAQLQRLDETLFAPLLAHLAKGGTVKMVLTRRDALAQFTTSKMAQRQFWRRPTLDRLLP